jgi:hypothetical protein
MSISQRALVTGQYKLIGIYHNVGMHINIIIIMKLVTTKLRHNEA